MSINPGGPPRSRALLAIATTELRDAGIENPRFEAEVILAVALHTSRAGVLASIEQQIDSATRASYVALVRRRTAREPLAYIVGHKEFYSLKFEVTPEVLIPRPETETLVAAALEWLTGHPAMRVLDLGTGSGAIGLAIASNASAATVVASDFSAGALEVAQRNAKRLHLHDRNDRILFRRANCFEIMDGGEDFGTFALIVSNPPYVRDAEITTLQPEVAAWEPHLALAGGPDGLNFYRRIAHGLRNHLAAGGALILEIGDDQASAVTSILSAAGLTRFDLLCDLSGTPRVLRAAY